MKAKVLSKIMRLEEYVRLVARAVAVEICPVCGCHLDLKVHTHHTWSRSSLVCPTCGFKHYIRSSIIHTIQSNQIGEDQMTIDFGEEKPPLTKI